MRLRLRTQVVCLVRVVGVVGDWRVTVWPPRRGRGSAGRRAVVVSYVEEAGDAVGHRCRGLTP